MRTLQRAARVAPFVVCIGAVAPAHAQTCHGPLHAADVVGCALAASPELHAARANVAAVEARRMGAGLVLPANPLASAQLEGSVRAGPNTTVITPTVEWQVMLSQTVEVAGQRGRRLAVNDAEGKGERQRRSAVAQQLAADSLRAFYELVAARANVVLAEELGTAVELLARFAEERAKESLLAPVDAHLVRAEAVRIGALRAETRRRAEVARARLRVLLGADDVDAVDEPTPVPNDETLDAATERALASRAELSVAAAEREVAERQAALLRRERIPDVTLSAFTGTNVLGEMIVGGALAVPLPLPAPVGRTNAAAIGEALARRDRAEANLEQVRRRVRIEVAEAFANQRARAATLALYSAELTAQARADVRALREGLANRQLSPRDALVAERTLIELLLGESEARLSLALAVVELRRATADLVAEVPR
jgi:cobalt-zinc-cadmium efflux system outer membrane protein